MLETSEGRKRREGSLRQRVGRASQKSRKMNLKRPPDTGRIVAYNGPFLVGLKAGGSAIDLPNPSALARVLELFHQTAYELYWMVRIKVHILPTGSGPSTLPEPSCVTPTSIGSCSSSLRLAPPGSSFLPRDLCTCRFL